MKVNNIIDVAEDENKTFETKTFPSKFITNTCINKIIDTVDGSVQADIVNNEASTQEWLFKQGKLIRTIDGSIQSDIVINSEDKEYVNEDNKLLDEEREAKREIYFRQARSLYPEKEDWILNMAIDAFMRQEEKGIDITTHSFMKNEIIS